MKTICPNDGGKQPALRTAAGSGKPKPTELTSEELHRRLTARYHELGVRHDKVSRAA